MNRFEAKELNTMTMTELFDTAFEPRLQVVKDFLGCGTYLIAGPPKAGKSFLVLQIAYSVAKGLPFWGHEVHSGDVLYLALEDNYERLQQRLSMMFGEEDTEHLHMAIAASTLKSGLLEQIALFRQKYPDTRLVIIDTLQKVRDIQDDSYSYQRDYDFMDAFKGITDSSSICVLIVHHTRKQETSDSVAKISGTNGISGSADGSYILDRENRLSDTATLEIICRDMPDQKLFLKRDPDNCQWLLTEEEVPAFAKKKDPVIEAVAAFINQEQPFWEGSASELLEQCPGLSELIKVNAVTKRLNLKCRELFEDHRILYEPGKRTTEKRILKLSRTDALKEDNEPSLAAETPENDSYDSNDGFSGTGQVSKKLS